MIYWFVGSIYLLASIGLCYVVWRLTSNRSNLVRALLRYTCAALLLTPWFITTDSPHMAPAFIVFLFDLLRSDHDLLYAAVPLGTVLLGGWVIIFAKYTAKTNPNKETPV